MALIFVLAFAVRLAILFAVGASHVEFGDARDYLETSRIVCTQGDYPTAGNLGFFRAPGYPLFISTVTACQPWKVLRLKIFTAAVDSLTVVLIALLAALCLPSGPGLLLAATVAACHPILAFQTSDVRSEPLFMFLVTAALVAFLVARGARPRLLAAAGLLLGLAALTRPAALIAIPYFASAWVVGSLARERRKALLVALLFLGAAAAVVAPWSTYISSKHGELILVNDAGGYNLWRGTHPDLIAAMTSPTRDVYRDRIERFELSTSASAALLISREATSPMARDRAWRSRFQDRLESDPRRFLSALGGNLWRLWRPWLNPLEHPTWIVLASAAVLIPILLLGLLGLAHIRASQPWLFGFVLGWFLWISVWLIPFQTVMRFRIPLTDPLLIALIPAGLASLRSRFARRAKLPASGGDTAEA